MVLTHQTGQKRDNFFTRISQGDIHRHNRHYFVLDKTFYRDERQKEAGIVPLKTFSRNQLLFRKKDYLCVLKFREFDYLRNSNYAMKVKTK